MRMIDLIVKKREGLALSGEEIEYIIGGFTRGEIPDYQVSAWLMAVVLKGMEEREITDLTLAMAHSGQTLDLKPVATFVVDKHSSGGVGDKTTLVVAPLVAAAGLPVAKMTGRGLGFSGGTLDKLESIPGFNVNLTKAEFLENLARHGIVVAGQSADLAPADGKLYALRDVTGTVESIPLIASSIMSKKIAAGADAVVLDVKVGRGAFMKTLEEAEALAQTMVKIGRGVGRRVTAVISDMSQPLGYAVGNALEVKEAIATLQGSGPADFTALCLAVAGQMVLLAGKCATAEETEGVLQELLASGKALDKFREFVRAQGGDAGVVEHPELMAQARYVDMVTAPQSGYLAGIDAQMFGLTAVTLGGGRAKKGETIDHGVGMVLQHKVGDRVEQGEAVVEVHANDRGKLLEAKANLSSALSWSRQPVKRPALVHGILGGGKPPGGCS
jgi:pyrimidine-nucleoside phosphorylase